MSRRKTLSGNRLNGSVEDIRQSYINTRSGSPPEDATGDRIRGKFLR
jgi:hypothetical protein